jgi:hypothetical protein
MENSSRPLWKENRFYFAKIQLSPLEELAAFESYKGGLHKKRV